MHGDTMTERGVIDIWCMELYEKSSVQITFYKCLSHSICRQAPGRNLGD